jgi:hypothetical protein
MILQLMPDNAPASTPRCHPLIAQVGPVVSCLFVRPEGRNRVTCRDPLKDVNHITRSDNQWLATIGQCFPQCHKGLTEKGPVAGRHVSLLPKPGFDDKEWQGRPTSRRAHQRTIILHPEIPFEPDNLHVPSPMNLPPASKVERFVQLSLFLTVNQLVVGSISADIDILLFSNIVLDFFPK